MALIFSKKKKVLGLFEQVSELHDNESKVTLLECLRKMIENKPERVVFHSKQICRILFSLYFSTISMEKKFEWRLHSKQLIPYVLTICESLRRINEKNSDFHDYLKSVQENKQLAEFSDLIVTALIKEKR